MHCLLATSLLVLLAMQRVLAGLLLLLPLQMPLLLPSQGTAPHPSVSLLSPPFPFNRGTLVPLELGLQAMTLLLALLLLLLLTVAAAITAASAPRLRPLLALSLQEGLEVRACERRQ